MTQTIEQNDLLYTELLAVHKELAQRDNVSSSIMATCAKVGKDYASSLAATLLTTGETHAPLTKAYDLFARGAEFLPTLVEYALNKDRRVPGWGSDFVKGEPDPMFSALDELLLEYPVYEQITAITNTLHKHNKMVYPNAACYTAAVCLSVDMPKIITPYFLVQGRLETWTEIYNANYINRQM